MDGWSPSDTVTGCDVVERTVSKHFIPIKSNKKELRLNVGELLRNELYHWSFVKKNLQLPKPNKEIPRIFAGFWPKTVLLGL